MSCFNLQIKPPKSWRSVSSGLRSKLDKLKSSTSHVIATTCRLTSKSRRSRSPRNSYREIDTKSFMSIYVDQLYAAAERDEKDRAREAENAKPHSKASAGYSSNNHHPGNRVMNSESSSSAVQASGPGVDKIVEEKSVTYETVDDAWKAIVAKSPLLRVDERAEEFITKFREDMILQKEKSLNDYQEMIARGR